MRFRILGPVELLSDGRPLTVPGLKARSLLAVLVINANTVLPPGRLLEAVWGMDVPPTGLRRLHTHLWAIRRLLPDPADLAGTPAGYLLRVRPGESDLDVFATETAAARAAAAAGDLAGASAAFRRGLAQWRGPALVGVRPDLQASEGGPLEEQRLAALSGRIDVDLRLGLHTELVAELRQLTSAHPLNEHLRGQLITALHGAGRTSEALAEYQSARRLLLDELGIEPGEALARAHQAVLSGDATAPAAVVTGQAPAPAAVVTGRAPVPRQLPPDVPAFTGRREAVARLDELAAEPGDSPVVCLVSGTAGVGKTALAVHWAHRAAGRFPDGQLHLNLRGYDPLDPLSPGAALDLLLRGLGVETVPHSPDQRAALYRSVLAGKRMLILLDNARTAEQVRPLLPGTAGHLVLVTGRDSLPGLVARDGARRLRLSPLSHDEADDLLGRLLGHERAGSDPQARRAVVAYCAALPLALRIAAEHLLDHPGMALGELVDALAEESGRLDLLEAHGDPLADVRTVFSWSYRALREPAARLFRLLSLAPGPDFDVHAAANLAGLSEAVARRLLQDLRRASLVEDAGAGRHLLHDLLRAYSAERSQAEDDPGERRAALTRLLDWYACSARAAMDVVDWFRPPFLPPSAFAAAVPLPPFEEVDQAWAWLEGERANLVAAVRRAAADGLAEHAWRICHELQHLFFIRGYDQAWIDTHSVAVAAAQAAGDDLGVAATSSSLASYYAVQGRRRQALRLRECVVEHYHRLGLHHAEAVSRVYLADAHFNLGRLDETERECERALALSLAHDDFFAQVLARWGLARAHSRTGRFDRALTAQLELLALAEETGSLQSQSVTLVELATTHLLGGDLDQAMERFEQALRTSRQVGDRRSEIRGLAGIGTVRFRTVGAEEAISWWEAALELSRDQYTPDLSLPILGDLAQACHRMGLLDRAGEYRSAAEALAARLDYEPADDEHSIGGALPR
ncbi:AfsR/SARP family transcriptional regulator [Nonomuraea soli]|uniref:DNA-binding SARP family transcriptional activator n=1 Tax=Nonomuraea soli TaxID=1032476 RepID=A0A7W0CDV4_9ACTN|nr:BTAD domain-containing putative transcriptional regulator [Nonomuraea soli]MBA2889202.1 DNA-binding SARP family transcriptional activator [Nonomuraea soli]